MVGAGYLGRGDSLCGDKTVSSIYVVASSLSSMVHEISASSSKLTSMNSNVTRTESIEDYWTFFSIQ